VKYKEKIKGSNLKFLNIFHPIMYNNFTFNKLILKEILEESNDLYLFDFDSL